MLLISNYLFDSAHKHPDSVALVCGEQRLTYGGLASRATSLAGYLVSHGLQKGDRVAIFLENSPDAVT
ncbi:AMP-dependent synthetase, partial [bacterium]